MTNVLRFPTSSDSRRFASSTFFAEPAPHARAVQFYEEDDYLAAAVEEFLAAGLAAGDRLVVVATPAHRQAFVEGLERRPGGGAPEAGRLTLLDARETLSRFMIDGMPDRSLFRDVLSRILAKGSGGDAPRRVRVFGEMVDLLCRDGSARAALALEELWCEAGQAQEYASLSAYSMRRFYREEATARFLEVCKRHSHVFPSEGVSPGGDAYARLREISLLQQRAGSLEREILCRKDVEVALRAALRDRARAEEELRAGVAREEETRERAEASEAFEALFFGILRRELREPLNTVLATTRLMAMSPELGPESTRRLERVIVSGVRLERMIEQLLDMKSARLPAGIPVKLSEEELDLVPLVSRIVEEARAAHPARAVDFEADGPCRARVDLDRIAQVCSNLIGNAITYGAPDGPVRVTVEARRAAVALAVHNSGPPIDEAILPRLFDPFVRGAKPKGGARGLGLGLYIADRIVSAHWGKLTVESSEASGTRFVVTLPREMP